MVTRRILEEVAGLLRVRQRCGLQEVEVSGWIQRDVLNSLRMHHDIVEVPQVYGRDIIREYLLKFRVE